MRPGMDRVRTALGTLLNDTRLDGFSPTRVARDLAVRVNRTLGEPLCTAEELTKRKAAAARLTELRGKPRERKTVHVAAPVVVYVEQDRNVRELSRIEELLAAKGIAFEIRDVTSDPAALAFVLREAKIERGDLPAVFVGSEAVGPYPRLVAFDVAGKLTKAVHGT